MRKPNLFDFAISELSQDAVVAWVLQWADVNFSGPMHDFASKVLSFLFYKYDIVCPPRPSVVIKKQYCKIDVVAIVNNEFVVIVEDKTGTREHDNQLVRYRETMIKRGFEPNRLLCFYYRTENQSDLRAVKRAGYIPVSRRDLLELFSTKEGQSAVSDNAILQDYAEHIAEIEKEYNSYETNGVWNNRSWAGFYSWLQTIFDDGNWDKVNNQSGGFMGFWFWWYGGLDDGEVEAYLQLEESRPCFKIYVADKTKRGSFKYVWNKRIRKAAEMLGMRDLVANPSRLASGTYMTVAVMKDDVRCFRDGKLDKDGSLSNIRDMIAILGKAVELSKSS